MGMIRQWLGKEPKGETVEKPQSPWQGTEPDAETGQVIHPWAGAPGRVAEAEPAAQEAHDDDRTAAEKWITDARDTDPQTSFGQAPERLNQPDPLTDSGVHRRLLEPQNLRDAPLGRPAESDFRERCQGCGRPLPTDHERIQSSLQGVSATDLKHLVAVPFYSRLFTEHEYLIIIFPEEMVYPIRDDPEDKNRITGYERNPDGTIKVNPQAAQIDLIISAVGRIAESFDPDDEQAMEGLRTDLAKLGRSHLRFDPPAKIEEYAAVTVTLLAVLADVLGAKFDTHTELSWRKALEFASGVMLTAQSTARMTGVGRRRRTV